MTSEEMIVVIKAHAEGKKIECSRADQCGSVWTQTHSPAWNFVDYDYRIKPEPKIRPWIREEVPVGMLVRYKGTQGIYLILGVREDACYEVIIAFGVRYTRAEMLEFFDYSPDHGKTWKICGVEE